MAHWRAEGVVITQVGPDIVRGLVVVGTADPEKDSPRILGCYGDGVAVMDGPTIVPVPFPAR
jgi:hypothetical protein